MVFLLLFLYIMSRHRYGKTVTAVILGVCFLLTEALDYHVFFIDGRTFSLLATMLEILLVQGVALLISEYRDFRGLLTGIMSAAFVLVGNVLCSAAKVTFHSTPAALAVQTATHVLVLLFMVLPNRELYLNSQEDYPDMPWGRICLLPSMFYAATYLLAVWPVSIYKTPEMAAPTIAVMLLMGLSFYITMLALSDERTRHQAEQQDTAMSVYRKSLAREALLLQESSARAAVVRHDLRHYAALISTYLDAGDEASIRKMIAEMMGSLDQSIEERFCENVAINGILSLNYVLAKEKKIRYDCETVFPAKLSVSEADLAVAVSNLVENALRAADEYPEEDKRWVRIRSHEIKEQLMVEVSNPYKGRIRRSRHTGLPVFPRRGGGHGYGLLSVQRFAAANGALFDVKSEKGVFTARLLIKR
jgi:signal transduction histidine kinase